MLKSLGYITALVALLGTSKAFAGSDDWITPTARGNFLVCPSGIATEFSPYRVSDLHAVHEKGGIKGFGSVAYINNTPEMSISLKKRLSKKILDGIEVPTAYILRSWGIFPREARRKFRIGTQYMSYKYENPEQKKMELILNDRLVGGNTIVDSKGKRLSIDMEWSEGIRKIYCYKDKIRVAFVFYGTILGEWSGEIKYHRPSGTPYDYPKAIPFKNQYGEKVEGPTIFFLHDAELTSKNIKSSDADERQSGFDL